MPPDKAEPNVTEGPGVPGGSAVAAIRWRARDLAWIGGATALVLLADAALHAFGSEALRNALWQPGSHLAFLAVATVAVGYAIMFRRRRRRLVTALSLKAPTAGFRDLQAMLEGHLHRASEALDAPVLVVWEDANEPSVEVAHWNAGRLDTRRESPEAFRPLVAPELATDRFATNDASRDGAVVFRAGPTGLRLWRGIPIHRALVERFRLRRLVSAAFAVDDVTGRVFAMLNRPPNDDDLVIVGAVARRLGEALARVVVTRRLFDVAAMEERDRLSRELHDGVLQSLAGAALHLKRAERLVESEPLKVANVLAAAQQMLADEQRDLRFYVQDLRPLAGGAGDSRPAFEARLRQLGSRVTDVWGLSVRLNLDAMPTILSARTMHELYRVAQEALANAARHSKATVATLTITGGPGSVRITIHDDGRGFPFRGRFADAELREKRLGPVTLKARVHALGGSLAIESTDMGARIDIEVPLSPTVT